jgi:hypothetical protein
MPSVELIANQAYTSVRASMGESWANIASCGSQRPPWISKGERTHLQRPKRPNLMRTRRYYPNNGSTEQQIIIRADRKRRASENHHAGPDHDDSAPPYPVCLDGEDV